MEVALGLVIGYCIGNLIVFCIMVFYDYEYFIQWKREQGILIVPFTIMCSLCFVPVMLYLGCVYEWSWDD